MYKEELLREIRAVSQWIKSLHEEMSDSIWFESLTEGKWATADVISHFITWDRFMLEHRLPYIQKAIPFPKLDINPEKMNMDSSVYARSGIDKQRLLQEYVNTREVVISQLEELTEDTFSSVIIIGKNEMKVIDYFYSHVQHDVKHKQQIVDFLKKTSNPNEVIKNG
jgi:hypothetical protein